MNTNIMRFFCVSALLLTLIGCSKSKVIAPKPLPIEGTINLPHQTENLVFITLDGYRWQEVFRGADSALLFKEENSKETNDLLREQFWSDDVTERRAKLSPFFWNELVKEGKLYGNRDLGNKVNVTNKYWISFPGYSEIFTGFADPAINQNGMGPNPNYNFLEFLQQEEGYKDNALAAFCQSAGFYNNLNRARNELNITAGLDLLNLMDEPYVKDYLSSFDSLNLYSINGTISMDDKNLFIIGRSYLAWKKPKVMYLSFLGTDTYGHSGKYVSYLKMAYNTNVMIGDIWDYIQSNPNYKDKTTMVITTDHGRGEGENWKFHGKSYLGSDQIWFAAIGPDTKPLGEINNIEQNYQNQFAASLVGFLGFKLKLDEHATGKRIYSVMDKTF